MLIVVPEYDTGGNAERNNGAWYQQKGHAQQVNECEGDEGARDRPQRAGEQCVAELVLPSHELTDVYRLASHVAV